MKFFIKSSLLTYMAEQEESKREEFAKEFMAEEGLKGKARKIKIMKIIETVGYDKRKVKTALARSTITDRIHHD
ncbi:MAG: hypothetical protein ACFE8B_06165 [Candidatus Hermodarchaeota archaeon]